MEHIIKALDVLIEQGYIGKAEAFDILRKKPLQETVAEQSSPQPAVKKIMPKTKTAGLSITDFVKENYGTMKAKDIGKKLNIKQNEVYQIAQKLGLNKYLHGRKKAKGQVKLEEKPKDYDDFIITNMANLTNKQMADEMGVSISDIDIRINFLKRIGRI